MKKPNRIGMYLFDDELKALINASAKIFPISQEDVDSNYNPNNYEYGRIGNAIYRWEGGEWGFIIADDIDIEWLDIKNKPNTYPPATHTHSDLHNHSNKSVIDTITQTLINTWNTVTGKADRTYVDTELNKKSNVTHNHDLDYSKLTHNHDGAYYKKSDIDAKLGDKADKNHSHDYSPNDHNHDEIYLNKTHGANKIIHITQEERESWNSKAPFKYEQEFLELRDHYGYMNIDGGAFDGGDGYYLMIDGGVF